MEINTRMPNKIKDVKICIIRLTMYVTTRVIISQLKVLNFMEIKIKCKRCKKSFEIPIDQLNYLQKKANEMKSELIMPKLCDDCRIIKEQVKSIPMKMQMICNQILEKSKDAEVNKDVMLLFGLARKQMKESLVNYRFIDKTEN